MIVWSGRGILILFIFVFSTIVARLIMPDTIITIDYPLTIGLLITSLFSWFAGKSWNDEISRIEKDQETGQITASKKRHALLGIQMHYWGIILPIVAVLIIGRTSIWKAVNLTLFILLFIVLFRVY